jgi:hypothetical protein
LDEFYTWLDRRFNSYWVSSAALALTIGLNMIYFYQIFQHQEFTDWITSGKLLGFLSTRGRGLTTVGLYAALICFGGVRSWHGVSTSFSTSGITRSRFNRSIRTIAAVFARSGTLQCC